MAATALISGLLLPSYENAPSNSSRKEALVPEHKAFWNSYNIDSSPHILGEFSRVNIFVGGNNSGKSRLLRWLYLDIGNIDNLAASWFAGQDQMSYLKNGFTQQMRNLSLNNNDLGRAVRAFFDPEFPRTINNLYAILVKLQEESELATFRNEFGINKLSTGDISSLPDTLISAFLAKNKARSRPKCVYIPMLRGMRPLVDDDEGVNNSQKNDFLRLRTLHDYFQNSLSEAQRDYRDKSGLNRFKSDLYISTGLEIYEVLKTKLLGKHEDREAVRKYEVFLSENFFDGDPLTLIPAVNSDTITVRINEDPDLPIHQLGDGLQNLIALTFPIFMENDPCAFFIEEPDLSMHPGLQRIFMNVLAKDEKHQFFMTTHSNHLLDMSMDRSDVSVFLLQKEVGGDSPQFRIRHAGPRDFGILRELGVHSSSVFHSNATVWVEGIYDRLYLRLYMKKYLQDNPELPRLQEDRHYSFVEYGGANIVHWDFSEDEDMISLHRNINANFLCSQAIIVADGDIVGKGDRTETLTEILGKDRLIILDGKEIENLIPEKLLIRYLETTFGSLDESTLKGISFLKYSVQKQSLSRYLDNKLKLESPLTSGNSFNSYRKEQLCSSVLRFGESDIEWALTPMHKQICSKIVEFICRMNDIPLESRTESE